MNTDSLWTCWYFIPGYCFWGLWILDECQSSLCCVTQVMHIQVFCTVWWSSRVQWTFVTFVTLNLHFGKRAKYCTHSVCSLAELLYTNKLMRTCTQLPDENIYRSSFCACNKFDVLFVAAGSLQYSTAQFRCLILSPVWEQLLALCVETNNNSCCLCSISAALEFMLIYVWIIAWQKSIITIVDRWMCSLWWNDTVSQYCTVLRSEWQT